MKVIIVEPGEEPYTKEINNELKDMQNIVGGYIEIVPLFHDIVLVCNEEGILLNLPYNRFIKGNEIFGTFFICKNEAPELTGLTDEEADHWLALLELIRIDSAEVAH